jgi:nucleoside-diphosphate-sugar epimerase
MGGGYEPEPIDVDYLPVDEAHPLRPSTAYGIGKQTLEIVADGFARRSADRPRTITSLRFPWVVDDGLSREAFLEVDRTLTGLRDAGEFRTQRNTLFSYVHLSDAVDLVRRTVDATFDGHERVWVSAPDTSVEAPSRELAETVYPDADRRDALDEGEHAALIDTGNAETLFDWVPEWSWRQLR